jgi:murein L,D-transpeptidase YcbB/YkuD
MAQDAGKPEAQAAGAMDPAAAPKERPDAKAQKPADQANKPANAHAVLRELLHAAPLEPAPAAAPDPLTPPEPSGPAPKAPGAVESKPVEAAKAPEEPIDPVAKQILAHATKAGSKSEGQRDDLGGLAAYYSENKGHPLWVSKEGFNARATKAIREIRNADDWGLDSSAFSIPQSPGASASPEAAAEAEIKLSLAVLKYARYARGGRLDPPSLSPLIDRRPHIFEPKSVLEGISSADSADAYLRNLHPKSEQFKRLRQAYLALGSSKGPGGGSARPSSNEDGEDGNADGDSGARRDSGSFSEKRMRILVNMERWRWMPESLGDFYVWDSVPEQFTRIFDHGKMVLQEKIVVGKPDTPTPSFSAPMEFVTFNPEWSVPEGIKVNEIAPKLRSTSGGGGGGSRNNDDGPFFMFGGGGSSGGGSASDMLQRLGGLRVSLNGKPVDPDSVNWGNVDIRRYQFTQGASGKNVLGVVKFRFPNKFDVYMHDTPDRHLFGDGMRAFSHGCMRTQNPVRFAEVLLAHDKGMSSAQIQQIVSSGETNEIQLRNRIPVHIAYFTAEADEKGRVRTYPDIYGLDGKVASALRGQPVHFASEPLNFSAPEASEPDPDASSWMHSGSRSRPTAERTGAERTGGERAGAERTGGERAGAERRPWNPFQDWN